MSIKENKALVRRYLSANANEIKKDADRGKDDYHAPEFKCHTTMGDMNLKDYIQFMSSSVVSFPDGKYTVDDIIAEGDKVAGRYHFTGTNTGPLQGMPPTGKRVSIAGIATFKVTGGKLVEAWMVSDALGLMQQLGAIPTQ